MFYGCTGLASKPCQALALALGAAYQGAWQPACLWENNHHLSLYIYVCVCIFNDNIEREIYIYIMFVGRCIFLYFSLKRCYVLLPC